MAGLRDRQLRTYHIHSCQPIFAVSHSRFRAGSVGDVNVALSHANTMATIMLWNIIACSLGDS